MPGFGSGAGREEQLSWQAFALGQIFDCPVSIRGKLRLEVQVSR